MSHADQAAQFYIGWDVGGWNCDKNPASRDALVILDFEANAVGSAWRGNLLQVINKSTNTREWVAELFRLCAAEFPARRFEVVLGIDTPLGFSRAFLNLLNRSEVAEPIERSSANPYLFRETERFLFENGLTPLSPVKDMIGSQATKGMHVLAKFAPKVLQCGVWGDGVSLTAIEAYPSACKNSPLFQRLLRRYVVSERVDRPARKWVAGIDHQDEVDALTCALIAHAFRNQPQALAQPYDSIPSSEGWIWVPADALAPAAGKLRPV